MKKIYKNIIIGSGFSSFALNKFLKKDFLIITTNENLINTFPKRPYLTPHLRLFYKKFASYGLFKYSLNHSTLHDTIIDGGNSNFWGGICNIRNVKNYLKSLKDIIHFQKINIKETGSYSKNNFLYQMQEIKGKNNKIFNCAGYLKNLVYGHLINFKVEKKNIILLNVKKKNVEKFYCKNLILAVNATQLIEILVNSNLIKENDTISLEEHQFKTKISFSPNLYNQKKGNLILSYSFSGILKHALGIRQKFNKYLSNLLNILPLFYHQIFYNKKISAHYRYNKFYKTIEEVSNKTVPDFGKSVHYFNMKINKVGIEKFLNKKTKNIFGVSSPFIIDKDPGPISNSLIEKSFLLGKKLNKS